jgi:rsbT co-antagonist protein RsbR
MAALQNSTLEAIASNQSRLIGDWIAALEANGAARNIKEQDLRQETRDFLQLVVDGLRSESGGNIAAAGWEETRRFLEKLSTSRAQAGQESHQTAYFIFALKGPLFTLLQSHYREQPALLAEQLWEVSELLDAFGLHTIRTYQKTREGVIKRQQEELLELSTGSEIAIIDITGVPTVDTLVAQHLLKTVTAIRLMGADCIISGVRPQIAQTIVHLGLDLGTLTTKSNLADALKLALTRLGTRPDERV